MPLDHPAATAVTNPESGSELYAATAAAAEFPDATLHDAYSTAVTTAAVGAELMPRL